jgi:hypothetical protein
MALMISEVKTKEVVVGASQLDLCNPSSSSCVQWRQTIRGKRLEEGQIQHENSTVGEITRTRTETQTSEPGCKRAKKPREPADRQ